MGDLVGQPWNRIASVTWFSPLVETQFATPGGAVGDVTTV